MNERIYVLTDGEGRFVACVTDRSSQDLPVQTSIELNGTKYPAKEITPNAKRKLFYL